jgi:DNA-binding MarR family transcriptional regulator
MSAEARTWAKKQRTGSPAAKSVLVALADYAGSEHGECWPSQATLARETELSERAVRKYLKKLEDDGFIKRKRRGTESGGRTSDLITLDMKDERHRRQDVPEGNRHDVPGGYRHHVPGGYRHHVPGAPAPRSGEPSLEPSLPMSEDIGERARMPFALTPPGPPPETRACRLPPDWQPNASDLAFARGEGLSQEEISREADRFRDHWVAKSGKDATKRDWSATWRNWIRNRDRYGGQSPGHSAGRGSGGNRREPPSVVEAAARAARRFD